jgi:hypothetical protein
MEKDDAGEYVFVVSVILFCIIAWFVNLYKLTVCDFDSDYKCEVMHGLGVIPALAPFVVWIDTDEDKE